MVALAHFCCLSEFSQAQQSPPVVLAQQPRVDSQANAAANNTLQTYNLPPEMVGTVGATLRVKYGQLPGVTVTTEPGTDRLMVMAPDAVHREIIQVVDRINTEVGSQTKPTGPAPAPAETQRLYQLRHANCDQFEVALQQAGGRMLSEYKTVQGVIADYRLETPTRVDGELRVDRRNKSVLLQGSSKGVAAWQRAIAAIDNSFERGAPPTEIVSLGQAKPENVRRAVTLVRTVAFQDEVDVDDQGVVQLDEDAANAEEAATAIGSPKLWVKTADSSAMSRSSSCLTWDLSSYAVVNATFKECFKLLKRSKSKVKGLNPRSMLFH